jgi:hypothetical protein
MLSSSLVSMSACGSGRHGRRLDPVQFGGLLGGQQAEPDQVQGADEAVAHPVAAGAHHRVAGRLGQREVRRRAQRVLVEAGGEVGYGWSWQDIAGGLSKSGGDLFAGPTATATVRAGPFRVGLDGSFGAQLFKVNGESTVRPQASLALVLLFGMGR